MTLKDLSSLIKSRAKEVLNIDVSVEYPSLEPFLKKDVPKLSSMFKQFDNVNNIQKEIDKLLLFCEQNFR